MEFKCPKCGCEEIGVTQRGENKKIQKLKNSRNKIIEHVESEDIVYQCFCSKCIKYFELYGDRIEYGSYTNNEIYELL